MSTDAVDAVLEHYPRIYFACHSRHARDPRSGDSLSSHAVSILDHLSQTDPTTLSTLSEHMGVTSSTMSVAIDRLELDGYVKRKRDRADKRRLELRLTAKGQRIREAHSVLDRSKVAAMLGRLSDTERVSALRGLALLADAASRLGAERADRSA